MSNITRWNPVQDLITMNDMFNRDWFWPLNDSRWSLPTLDMFETDNAVVVKAELPGFDANQVDVRVEGNTLHIKGNRTDEKNEGQYHLRERQMVSFDRSLSLPVSVDSNKAQAEFENGVLTLTLPKTEEAMPRRINVTPKKQITTVTQK